MGHQWHEKMDPAGKMSPFIIQSCTEEEANTESDISPFIKEHSPLSKARLKHTQFSHFPKHKKCCAESEVCAVNCQLWHRPTYTDFTHIVSIKVKINSAVLMFSFTGSTLALALLFSNIEPHFSYLTKNFTALYVIIIVK